MLARLDNPKIFSDVISIISEMVTEVKIKFDERGMSIVAIDPANVAMVSFRLPREAFSQYESGTEVLGVNLDSLKAVLRRTKSGSILIMENNENILKLDILDKIKRSFSLALIEINGEEKNMPQLEFLSQIQMNPSDFVDAIEDCTIVADSCTFISSPEKFIIEASGLNSARSEYSIDEVRIISGQSKSKYSLEYLQKFTKASKIADKIFINFSTDHPVKLEFKKENFDLSFILAPRVENED
ncbi:MAG TPA: proliferating cell nuclear antigen (pcna) [Candidatus Paceibacterota bacterium]|nr:proliferating cell nuclear antigen (pcna) [Candidatus Paceibacterota bacterium]